MSAFHPNRTPSGFAEVQPMQPEIRRPEHIMTKSWLVLLAPDVVTRRVCIR